MPVDDSWRNDPYTGGIPKHDYDSPSREYQRLFFGNPAQPDTERQPSRLRDRSFLVYLLCFWDW